MATITKLALGGIICIWILFCASVFSFASSDKAPDVQEDKTTIEEVAKKIGVAAESIGDYSVRQRDEAVKKAQQELDELDRNIDSLEGRIDQQWDHLSDETKRKWRKTFSTLKNKRIEAAEWYGGVKRGSVDAWDEIKKGYGNAYKELEHAWRKAKDEFTDEREDKVDSKK